MDALAEVLSLRRVRQSGGTLVRQRRSSGNWLSYSILDRDRHRLLNFLLCRPVWQLNLGLWRLEAFAFFLDDLVLLFDNGP